MRILTANERAQSGQFAKILRTLSFRGAPRAEESLFRLDFKPREIPHSVRNEDRRLFPKTVKSVLQISARGKSECARRAPEREFVRSPRNGNRRRSDRARATCAQVREEAGGPYPPRIGEGRHSRRGGRILRCA